MGRDDTTRDNLETVSAYTNISLANTSPSFVAWLCDRINKVRESQDAPFRVLDFGGGNVIIGKQLVENYENIDYTCYDLSELAVMACSGAEDMRPRPGSSAKYVHGEALEALSGIRGEAGVILFIEIFPYLSYDDIHRALELARERLSPTGKVFVVDADANKIPKGYKSVAGPGGKRIRPRPMDIKKLRGIAAAAGFQSKASHVGNIQSIKGYGNFVYHTKPAYLLDLGKLLENFSPRSLLGQRDAGLSQSQKKSLAKMDKEHTEGEDIIDGEYTYGDINASEAERLMREKMTIMFRKENQQRIRHELNNYFLMELKR